MSSSNYFIIHGSFGSPFVNWLPWLRKELRNRSKEVYTPDFPTGVGYQNYENWSRLLKVYLDAGLITENTIIFAHSIAPIFVCKFLIENKVKVKRLVFVCGFNNYLGIDEEYDDVNRGMFLDSLADAKKYCDEIVCFYSENDPYPALFVSEQRKGRERLRPGTIQMVVKNCAKKAGLSEETHPHTLRHSFATDLLKKNTNPVYVKNFLGHANIQTTMQYMHVVDEDLRAIHAQKHTIAHAL